MLKDFLAKLGANTKITIGVSVSPGVGLEMMEIDNATKTVSKYGCKPLDYNYSTREIQDYDEFQSALSELFEELQIPKKSNIVLTLPNVHFGMIGLPLLLIDDAITNAILSEVEQSYIFKRQEPVLSWVEVSSNIDTEKRNLAYTAIQQSALDGVEAACQEIGCTLSAVETSYSSFLKALYYTDIANDQLKDNITWNLMIIGQNNYSIFSMVGKRIIEFYEEPLALKSFVDDEIYNAIATSAQLTLVGLPANYLFIASETDLVSAEALSLKVPFPGEIKFLECNKYTQTEIAVTNLNILPSLALKMTPEVIGSAIYRFCDVPLKFNLLGVTETASPVGLSSDNHAKINIGNVEVELTPDFFKKVCGLAFIILIVPAVIFGLILDNFLKSEQIALSTIMSQVTQKTAEIKQLGELSAAGVFDLSTTVDNIISQNRLKLFYYSSIGMSTPNKLWVEYYKASSTGGVDIKGKATDVESIYTFYKGIKQLVNNSNIRLYKLEVLSGSIDDVINSDASGPKFYEFEITNMSPEELNPPPVVAPGGEVPSPTDPNQKKSPLLVNPLARPASPTPTPPPATPVSNTPPAPPLPPAPAGPNPRGQDQLPNNLEKIEKF